MLGLQREERLGQSAVKLLQKNSNACDHSPPTLQTDGRTDNLSWQYCAMLRFAR